MTNTTTLHRPINPELDALTFTADEFVAYEFTPIGDDRVHMRARYADGGSAWTDIATTDEARDSFRQLRCKGWR